jgi:hypothetical protein
MERLRLIDHKGKQIVLLDFTNATDPAQTVIDIRRAKAWFAEQPPTQALRTVSDVTGARYNSAVLEALKDLAAHNKPYVGAAAGVVKTALHRVALNVTALFSQRKFAAFTNREEALDWVVAQSVGPPGGEKK